MFRNPHARCWLLVGAQVTFYHILKLFQNAPDVIVGKKPVVSEFYEEIVFQEPTVMMQQLLQNVRALTTSPVKHDTDCESFFAIRT